MNVTDDNPLPFGVGRILEVRKTDFKFQWMGNTDQVARGTFRPAWFDSGDKKYYYRHRPTHGTHRPYLGEDCNVFIDKGQILAHGHNVLNDFTRIGKDVRDIISKSVWVKQAWGGNGEFSFNGNL